MNVSNGAARSLYVVGSKAPRPPAQRVIFCDGGVDATYRPGVDIELSHWIPNSTPVHFKASTSTEICMKYVESVTGHVDELVINNHVDVDGVLSTFVLMYPEMALRHRDAIVQAAEMGDFASWGESPAQYICQSLLCLIVRLCENGVDPLTIYVRCYEQVQRVLAGERFAECAPGIGALAASVQRVESGSIVREQVTGIFVHYAIPIELARRNLDAALYTTRFDMPLSSTALLLPNARAKYDNEKIHLVSVVADDGVYYDLWYPGYCWAETVGLWHAPGVVSTGSSNVHHLDFAPLTAATQHLQQMETADGRWTLARTLSPFATVPGRNFPIVLSFTRGDRPAASQVAVSVVSETLARAFASL